MALGSAVVKQQLSQAIRKQQQHLATGSAAGLDGQPTMDGSGALGGSEGAPPGGMTSNAPRGMGMPNM